MGFGGWAYRHIKERLRLLGLVVSALYFYTLTVINLINPKEREPHGGTDNP